MRVVFLGSPDFAVASLEALCGSQHKVVGVVSQPDRPAGRGLALKPPAVKEFALNKGLDLLQPESVNSPDALAWIRARSPDLLAVVAYGEFLKKEIRSLCPTPPINVHPSLLPQLRGAAPIQWAVILGLPLSGVSTQFMVAKMDAGDVLLQEEFAIGPDQTSEELFQRLAPAGGRLLVATLDALVAGKLAPKPQDASKATFAPLLDKAIGKIDWQKPSQEIHNLVRGLYPWPGAFTALLGTRVKVLQTKLIAPQEGPLQRGEPGEFTLFGERLCVATGSGWISLERVQPDGKRALLPRDFVNGIKGKISVGSKLQFGN